MTANLLDRLRDRLDELTHRDGRSVSGICADPICELQLIRAAPAAHAQPTSDGHWPTLLGYPFKITPREGLWIVLEPRDDEPTEVQV